MIKLIHCISWVMGLPLRMVAFIFGVSRTQLVLLFMVSGFVWVPLAQIQVLNDPLGTYGRIGSMGVGLLNAKRDIDRAMPPAVKYSQDKARRYHLDAWAKNTAIVSGTYREPLVNRIGGAITAPFKWVGGLIV